MVIVTDVIEKINSQTEKPFVLLEISGGLEMVQSQGTGKFYATMRKCRVPSTFNLDVAKMQISPPSKTTSNEVVFLFSDKVRGTNGGFRRNENLKTKKIEV